MSNLDKVIIVDIEATCWETENERPKNETNDIIEVGIAVVNLKNLVVEESEGIIVRPDRSKISPFCERLTTLTQLQVDKGVSFKSACDRLRGHYRSRDLTWISWGDYDRKQFEWQCRDQYIDYPFGPRHNNLKNLFAVMHGLNKEIGMDKALDMLNISLKGTHHRGVDDACNIASIFAHTVKKFRK